jgi:hypothetical protein
LWLIAHSGIPLLICAITIAILAIVIVVRLYRSRLIKHSEELENLSNYTSIIETLLEDLQKQRNKWRNKWSSSTNSCFDGEQSQNYHA